MGVIKDFIESPSNFAMNLDRKIRGISRLKPLKAVKVYEGDIVAGNDPGAQGAVIDESWVISEIHKMQDAIDRIELKYSVPRNLADTREQYNWFFAGRDARHCPKCGHDFKKIIQRATYCPSCESYLHVKYGHLLSDEDAAKYRKIDEAMMFTRMFGPHRINEVKIFAGNGADDIAKQTIRDFYQELSRVIDILND